MKLKDLLIEQITYDEIQDWVKQAGKAGVEVTITGGKLTVNEHGLISTSGDLVQEIRLVFTGNSSLPIFSSPFAPSMWDKRQIDKVNFFRTTVNDFQNVPDCQVIAFWDCKVESLSGIEKLKGCRRLTLVRRVNNHKPIGLLRLLKMPSLTLVDFDRFIEDEQASLTMSHIINKHLKDKDIADCMDELIEAGFKEYAKS
jgi:hypothetical protein